MQVCTSLQTDNHANTPPLSFFTGRMPFLPPNQQRQSTEGILLLYMCEIYTQHKVAEATSPQMRCVGRNDSTITWKSIFHKFSVQNPPVNDSRDMTANTSPFPSITMLLQHTNGHKREKNFPFPTELARK